MGDKPHCSTRRLCTCGDKVRVGRGHSRGTSSAMPSRRVPVYAHPVGMPTPGESHKPGEWWAKVNNAPSCELTPMVFAQRWSTRKADRPADWYSNREGCHRCLFHMMLLARNANPVPSSPGFGAKPAHFSARS